jgi:Zn-finger nucleic acid-binding protein
MNCPTCGKGMKTHTVYDVQTDVCQEHGMWLDKGELQKIIDGAQPVTAVDRGDERQSGRYEGIFLGWLSLLLR